MQAPLGLLKWGESVDGRTGPFPKTAHSQLISGPWSARQWVSPVRAGL